MKIPQPENEKTNSGTRCTQERKEAEAAEQTAKAESIRKAEERLAMRQRQAAEQAAKQEKEAQSLAEEAKTVEEEAGGELATGSPTTTTPSTQMNATHTDEASPDALNAEAAGTHTATPTPRADNTTTTAGGNDDNQGTNGEQIEAAGGGDVATTTTEAKAGVEGTELSTILEETTKMPGRHGSEAAPGETKGEYGNDEEEGKEHQGHEGARKEEQDQENIDDPSTLGVKAKQPHAAGPAGDEALQAMSEEAPQNDDTAVEPLRAVPPRGSSDGSATGIPSASGSGGGGSVGNSSRTRSAGDNPARAELAKQRKDIGLLVDQAKEGMVYIKQSVDMADVLRGFAFTRHGIPVRDTAVSQELMREGRSTLRERLDSIYL